HHSMAAARWRATALLASIVGVAASAYLLVEYTTGQPGLCLTGSGCDLVRASAFAYPLGIPTPLIGLVFYLVAAWLVLRTLESRRVAGLAPATALVLLAIAGATASMVLTGLEAFVIKAFCTWCLVQAGASLVLLVAAIALPRGDPRPAAEGHTRRARHLATQAVVGERRGLLRAGLFGGSGAALAVAVLLAVGATSGGSPSGSPDGSTLAPAGSPRLGSGPVEVVEFADFQCPGCAVVAPILTDIAIANGMTLVSRYFPLDSIHANADSSARAAAAAAKQGSFWEMSAAIYARQSAWKDLSATDADGFFRTLASDIGIDVEAWQAAYDSDEIAGVVDADRQAAEGLGLRGTPALFIDGRLYQGQLTSDAIRAAIAAVAPAA
ncbi:MAG: vitamin K epoxide reductase family protein, partial [Chloroflexota bacterium]|nr:vitamin K epoxide reductase family protein [Chloroflexota bacterium]